MRKHYIDNLRVFCILLLFPFHTAMVFNVYNEPFYIQSKPSEIISLFTNMIYPWWMTCLFALAGISTAYALKKRTTKQYIQERTKRLLIPLVSAIFLIIPIQCYISDIFHNGYSGSYFAHFKEFFQITDLTGYDGHFTPAHTWFLLYLYVISLITLPLLLWYQRRTKKIEGKNITIPKLLLMFLIILVLTPIFEPGGKSVGEFASCFLLGFFILSIDEVQERLEKRCHSLGILFVVMIIIHCLFLRIFDSRGIVIGIEQRFFAWIGILALLGLSRRYLDFSTKATQYFSVAAFPLYFFHQSILVVVGYFTLKCVNVVALQYMIILITTFILTVFCYEICRRFRFTCFLFGIKS